MAKESSAKPKKEKVKHNRLKEMGSELKKVSYPSFKKTVEQTGIVLSVVVFFALVLFGIDRLLSLLYELLVKGI